MNRVFMIMGLVVAGVGCVGPEPDGLPPAGAGSVNEPAPPEESEPVEYVDPLEAARAESARVRRADPADAAWREGFDVRAQASDTAGGAGEVAPVEGGAPPTVPEAPTELHRHEPSLDQPPPPTHAPVPVPEWDPARAVAPPPDVELPHR